MRSFSSITLLAASLLANEALAGPILKDRAVRIHNVIVTQEIVVTAYADGVLKTGAPKAVGTETLLAPPQVETTVRAISTIEDVPSTSSTPAPSPTPEPEPVSSSSPAPAVFKEVVATTSEAPAPAPEPTTSSAPAPSVEEAAPVVPTTLAKVVSSAAAVVSSVVAVATSAPAAFSGGKRGIAYNDASYLQAFSGAKSVSWCYNWGGNTHDVPSGFEYIPTLWGVGSHANNWNKYADEAIASGSKHLFSFNEPDHGEQANISPSVAADGYRQYMQPYAGKAKLGAPSVTNGGGEMGLTYLKNFLNACSGCTIDFINVHWYNGGDAAAFKKHMENAYEVGGKRPVWITEWQAPGSVAEQLVFLAEVLPWLDSQEWIGGYALFMASEGLMMAGSSLSEIGKAFVA